MAIKTGLSLDELTEDWAAVKFVPKETGLCRTVWITENQDYEHDVRVKVSRVRGGGGKWSDSISVLIRPICEEVRVYLHNQPRELPSDDLKEVCDWSALNRAVIIDFWDGVITTSDLVNRLQRLP